MSGYQLPLELAVDAAMEAIRSCEAHGYKVSVAVVDVSGTVKVEVKGDHSTAHTRESSFRKAYTVVTLGPIFKFNTTGAFAEIVAKSSSGPALISLANILPLAGGVAIKHGDEVVAAIGVGGAPGGEKDEDCAQAGVARIAEKIGTAPN